MHILWPRLNFTNLDANHVAQIKKYKCILTIFMCFFHVCSQRAKFESCDKISSSSCNLDQIIPIIRPRIQPFLISTTTTENLQGLWEATMCSTARNFFHHCLWDTFITLLGYVVLGHFYTSFGTHFLRFFCLPIAVYIHADWINILRLIWAKTLKIGTLTNN